MLHIHISLIYNRNHTTASDNAINPLNAELNPICHLLALAGAHHFVDVSRIRVKQHTNYNLCKVKHSILLELKQAF
jgi:hypothetical protein